MNKQLVTLGTAILTAVLVDLLAWLRARRVAKDQGQELPAYEWERLAERLIAGGLVGLGAGQIPMEGA